MEKRHLELLERAISDVGSWNWWTEQFPKRVQVEFVGTHLYLAEGAPGHPPVSQLALRFLEPVSVSFLSGKGAPAGWPQAMAADQMEPVTCCWERFHLVDEAAMERAIGEASQVETVLGCPPRSPAFFAAPAKLVFWAGPYGFAVAAKEMQAAGFDGPLTGEALEQASRRWWDYWRVYWERRGRKDPLPKDYACEVTIPVASKKQGNKK